MLLLLIDGAAVCEFFVRCYLKLPEPYIIVVISGTVVANYLPFVREQTYTDT